MILRGHGDPVGEIYMVFGKKDRRRWEYYCPVNCYQEYLIQ